MLLLGAVEGSLLEFETDLVGVGLCENGSLVRAVFFFSNSDTFNYKEVIVDFMSEMRCS